MTFSSEAWARNLPLYETIRTMPFNRDLAAGTLPLGPFRQYIVQDAHYLIAFGQALAIAAAKAGHPDDIVQFAEGAKVAIIVERALHGDYFKQFGISPHEFNTTPLSPTCHHYCSFLTATAWKDPYEVVLAAILPCFWIYAEVGRDIHGRAAPENPYQAWIDTYAGEDFHLAVKAVIATTDRVAASTSPATREAMHAAYTRAAQLEWMFWDSAYRQESWPV